MARPALATIEELEKLIGDVSDENRAQSLLEMASAIVRAYAGVLWLNDAGDDLEDVHPDIPGVVVQMVDRATSNPGGVTQETAGPFSRSFGSDAAQRLYLTRNDKLVIRAAVGAGSLGTISMTRGDLETAHVTGPGPTFPEETLPELTDLMGGS